LLGGAHTVTSVFTSTEDTNKETDAGGGRAKANTQPMRLHVCHLLVELLYCGS